MKKIVKITSLLLVVTTLCLFAMACSSYGKLEKTEKLTNFKKFKKSL